MGGGTAGAVLKKMATTALSAFFGLPTVESNDDDARSVASSSSAAAAAAAAAAADTAPNVFLESLFVRAPIQAPVTSSALAPEDDLSTMTKEDIMRRTAADPHTLLAAVMRMRERQQNPYFAEKGEENKLPAPDANHHHFGEPCKANERMLQVTRYGRVYKRKSPSLYIRNIKPNAPPGTRYCRFCEDFRPLDEFYTHIKRYVCRMHHKHRVWNSDSARVKLYPVDGTVAWLDLSMVRGLFGYHALNYDRGDMRALIIHAGLPWGLQPRLLPIDPSLPMRPRNVAAVSLPTFRMLVQIFQHTCSRALWIAHVQRCNLFPPNMDVGWPERPFHDPTYRRADIDVGPLLMQENEAGLGECVDRSNMELLIQREAEAPWTGVPVVAVATAMRGRLTLLRSKRPKKVAAEAAAPADI